MIMLGSARYIYFKSLWPIKTAFHRPNHSPDVFEALPSLPVFEFENSSEVEPINFQEGVRFMLEVDRWSPPICGHLPVPNHRPWKRGLVIEFAHPQVIRHLKD